MTSNDYKTERQKRGTQNEVAALLGVKQETISRRETGGEITREAWLALLSLPKKRKRRETVNCNAHQGYTKDFHYLQYQTSDGVWHDIPDAFEDKTAYSIDRTSEYDNP
jgi:DNA-binding XRE family transcriptional regulator